jgi:hypothetical protein
VSAATSTPLLAAATPQAWLATHLAAHFIRHDVDGSADRDHAWFTAAALLAEDAAVLHRTHARLVADDGATPAAAAKWVAGWFPGGLADAVGFTLATAAAALLLDGDAVRWRMNPGGWPDLVDPEGASMAVAAGHPWSGLPGVLTLSDDVEVAGLAVSTLTAVCDPLVLACRRLARVGATALWAEVADRFALAMLFDPDLPVRPDAVRRVRLGLAAAGARWRQTPDLRVSDVDGRPEYLGRKAGCCLAYQCPPGPELDLSAFAEKDRAFYTRFPPSTEPRYCSTCSLRDIADCEDRLSLWLRLERGASCG